MHNTICIIGVYFGQLPKYFDLWKKSAAYNETVDFLIVTDQQIIDLPPNIHLLKMSLSDMEKLTAAKLAIPDISISKPYKCCDFRPAYGIVFQEHISQYRYWGHCDFDMIFGDMLYFFDQYDLNSYDKFLTLGHLTLYRNTKENNIRYMCEGAQVDYRTVFTTNDHYAFDEVTGITQIYKKNNFSQFTKRIFCDIASIYNRYRDIEEYALDTKAQNHRNQIYYWKEGHVYRRWFDKKGTHEEEYIYIHFKKRPNFDLLFNADQANCFIISNTGFYVCQNEPDIEAVKKYNQYHPIQETIESLQNKLNPYCVMFREKCGK